VEENPDRWWRSSGRAVRRTGHYGRKKRKAERHILGRGVELKKKKKRKKGCTIRKKKSGELAKGTIG